jgi:hypothetical protein
MLSSSQQRHFEGFSWAEDHMSWMPSIKPSRFRMDDGDGDGAQDDDSTCDETDSSSGESSTADDGGEDVVVEVCDVETLRLSQRIGIPIPQSRNRGMSRSVNIPALPASSRLMHVSRVAAAH